MVLSPFYFRIVRDGRGSNTAAIIATHSAAKNANDSASPSAQPPRSP
jgi:hypothetical protein